MIARASAGDEAAQLLRACIVPDWIAPPGVRALITTRAGGVSTGERASLDLGAHGDARADVIENRRRLRTLLPREPHWLHQVHGARVVTLTGEDSDLVWPEADAAVTSASGIVCVVRVADCLPVFLADTTGRSVAIAHAGWRGLAAGVVEATLAAMRAQGSTRQMAWLGPAIGPGAFEVGDDVHAVFCDTDRDADACFTPGAPGKWQADLYALARRRLAAAGVSDVSGGGFCTRTESERFFSYRRDRGTGRMAALVWIR